MEQILRINEFLGGIVWGWPAMVLILGTGVWLSILCGFPQLTKPYCILKHTLGMAGRNKSTAGSVSSFQALCTALAASVGTGNIAGVSGAIALGGPGAVFWMWISALPGMCTKFAEVTLAVHYRERNRVGDWVGGPMYYIQNGLGRRWRWLGVLFCLFGSLSAFGIGNMAQVNIIASAVGAAVEGFVPLAAKERPAVSLLVGVICSLVVFFVLVGGIRRIGDVCSLLVPFMALIYVIFALAVIAMNYQSVPAAFQSIWRGAFDPAAVAGGLAGVGIKRALRQGVGRGIFTNEAGLGSAPIAHAAADVSHPAKQGLFGIFEVFMDTIVICTLTALVVLTGVGAENIGYGSDPGAALAIAGFESVFGDTLSGVIVAVCVVLFALASILTWGLYGARCCEYLFGSLAAQFYQLIFALFTVVGAVMELSSVWAIADTLNGLMALPNLAALVVLGPEAGKLSREYFLSLKQKHG